MTKFKNCGNILLFLIIYLIYEVIIQNIYIMAFSIPFDGEIQLTLLQLFILSLLSVVASIAVVAIFVKSSDNITSNDIGLAFKGRLKDLFIGTAVGGGIITVGFGILILLNEISIERVKVEPTELFLSLGLFIAVAFSEELIFRGYILSKLLANFGVKSSLIISSVIFAILHLGNDNITILGFFDLILAGILLGAFYLYTRNLWMVIGLHFGWNFIQTHLGFNVSGLDTYSVIEISIVQSNTLNGGSFGFEGSYLSTVAQFSTLCILFYLYKKKQRTNLNNHHLNYNKDVPSF
ncbi:MAG: CPBP family intramembrane metalloprotease [Psychrobium sp.]|nr:CPBP family intramembrane metalloprotease [Psychrobium sp.]